MVNIIGKGKTWAEAPIEGESWGITQLVLRRLVSLVIDMNVYDDNRWGLQEKTEAERARKKCYENEIPYIDLKTYPIEEITERFDTDYFSSTLDYAIALALYRGHKEINLYGVTMGFADYGTLKCGCDFWCGYAKGLGVEIKVHGESTAMKTVDGLVYGYCIKQK